MILGIGTDILTVRRMKTISEVNDAFIQKTFTKKELEESRKKDNHVLYFCTRFAGKEAVFKCLHIYGNEIKLSEIEILNKENGRPFVNLFGRALKIAEEKGINEIQISLSYDTDYAVAFALAQSK